MADTHQEDPRDPDCNLNPPCDHRHKAKDPCWHRDASNEMCAHAARCDFCGNGIQFDDGHLHVRPNNYLHKECVQHVPAENRILIEAV